MSTLLQPLATRPLRPHDAPAVARLHGSHRAGLDEGVLRLLYEVMASSPLAVVRVVEDGGRVVGFAAAAVDPQRLLSDLLSRCFREVLSLLARRPLAALGALRGLVPGGASRGPGAQGELLFMALEPDYRGRTLGVRMLKDVLEGLRLGGAESVAAWTPPGEVGARGILEANGFREEGPESGARILYIRRDLGPDPGRRPGPFSPADRLRCLLRLELLVLLPIYGLALIPFASLLAWLGSRLDRAAGLPPILPPPWNLAAAAVCLALGGVLLVWTYSYLVLEGEGGPVPPFSSKTRRLVTDGPYSVVRHPSVVAKLIGVVGLGLAFNSWSFIVVIVPMLVAWSVLWNRERQDADLVRVFGEEYRSYRDRTPMLVPRWSAVARLLSEPDRDRR